MPGVNLFPAPVPAVSPTIDRLVKEYVPSNVRLLASTALGARTPVTEDYFPETDLEAMRTLARNATNERDQDVKFYEGRAAQWGARPKKEPASYTLSVGENGQYVRTNIVTAQQKQAEDLAQVKKLNIAAPIRYRNYPRLTHDKLDAGGWTGAALESFTDPAYRVMNSIGRAHVVRDAVGNDVIKDEYSFHGGGNTKGNISQPTALFDQLMSAIVPKGKGRPVEINLGAKPK